jgi:hypothetical protein
MATPIKETPRLTGKNAEVFLNKLVSEPKTISVKELETRAENYNKLESMRKFK